MNMAMHITMHSTHAEYQGHHPWASPISITRSIARSTAKNRSITLQHTASFMFATWMVMVRAFFISLLWNIECVVGAEALGVLGGQGRVQMAK